MPCATSIEEAVGLAEQRWPGYEFKIEGTEAHGACPICHEADKDGFVVFQDGGYFCRPGGCKGWLDDDQRHGWTPEELRLRKIEARLNREEHEQKRIEQRVSALERLNRSQIHERYYSNLDERGYEWWIAKGCDPWVIQDYKLGMCPRCPTDREHRRSYTIPLFDQQKTKLLNLRHRLASAENGDKYRPEMSGLGTCLAFPHHLIDADRGIIVEGEIKAMVCGAHGFPTVGVFGKRGRFKGSWLSLFPDGPIYVGFDPDAADSADRLAHGLAKMGKEVYVIDWPAKPDDMLVEHGCSEQEWLSYVNLARRVH